MKIREKQLMRKILNKTYDKTIKSCEDLKINENQSKSMNIYENP